MQKGRDYRQVLPRGWSKGLDYNFRLPWTSYLDIFQMQWGGNYYTLKSDEADFEILDAYNIFWRGVFFFTITPISWQWIWSFPPSEVDPFVVLQLADSMGGSFVQQFRVPQPNAFQQTFAGGFRTTADLSTVATGDFLPLGTAPFALTIRGKRYH